MLVNVGPILVALLAGVILKEGFPRALVGGIAIAFAVGTVLGLVGGYVGYSLRDTQHQQDGDQAPLRDLTSSMRAGRSWSA